MIDAANDALDVHFLGKDLTTLSGLNYLLFVTNWCLIDGACPCADNDAIETQTHSLDVALRVEDCLLGIHVLGDCNSL